MWARQEYQNNANVFLMLFRLHICDLKQGESFLIYFDVKSTWSVL